MRALVAGIACVLSGCPAAQAPQPAAIVTLASSNAPTVVALGPRSLPYCSTTARSAATLRAAWPEGDRTHFCIEQGPDESKDPVPLTCASVGPEGDYRVEHEVMGTPPPMPAADFRVASMDGALSFRFTGGEREPKRARGTLLRDGKVVHSGPIAYDEHVAFEGWIGTGIVLRTWVDEGPGCGLLVVDAQVGWPSGLWSEDARGLGDCFGGYWKWKPTQDTYVVLAGDGSSVTFIDETTLGIEHVDPGRHAGLEEANPLVPWLQNDDLVLVYGAPSAGDVVRVSLRTRAVVARTPAACDER